MVWRRLGFDEIVIRACEVDRAGEANLEFLLMLSGQDLSILGIKNAREMIGITAWYL